MSQLHAPQLRRRGGEINVYTGLLLVTMVVLGIGVAILFMTNSEHSAFDGQPGGPFKVLAD